MNRTPRRPTLLGAASALLLQLLLAAPPTATAAPPAGTAAPGGHTRLRAELRRTFDDRIVVAVPVTPEAAKLLLARGFRACKQAGAEGKALICDGRAFYEYRVADKPLLHQLLESTPAGTSMDLELEVTPLGHITVVDAHK